MTFRNGKKLGLALAVPAAFFLCNPVIAFFDVLPDCIGYFLLLAALSRVADLNEELSESRRLFRILFGIGIGAVAVQFYLYSVLPAQTEQMNRYERPTLLLLFSFLLFVLQCIFLIPAWRHLFSGMQLLAQCHGGEAILPESSGRTQRRSYCDGLSAFFSVQTVLSSLFAVLPEATVLASMEYEAGNRLFPFDWYSYIRLFRSVALILSLILSVIALVRLLGFWKKVLSDGAWMDSLDALYEEEVLPDHALFFQRQTKKSFFLLTVGVVFSVNIRIEERQLLPGFAAALLIAAGVFLLKESFPGRKALYASCGGLFALSVAALASNTMYLRRYVPEASLYYADAYRSFLVLRILNGAEAVAFLAVAFFLLRGIYRMALAKTRVVYAGANASEISERATSRLHRGYFYRVLVIFLLFFAAMVGNLAVEVFRLRILWLWWIPLLLTVVAVCLFSSLLNDLRTQLSEQAAEQKSDSFSGMNESR